MDLKDNSDSNIDFLYMMNCILVFIFIAVLSVSHRCKEFWIESIFKHFANELRSANGQKCTSCTAVPMPVSPSGV